MLDFDQMFIIIVTDSDRSEPFARQALTEENGNCIGSETVARIVRPTLIGDEFEDERKLC